MYTSNIYRFKIYNVCKYNKQDVWATVRPLSAVNAHTAA